MVYTPTQEGAWIHVWHSISINVGRTDVVYMYIVDVHGQKWSKEYSMFIHTCTCMHLPCIILHIQVYYNTHVGFHTEFFAWRGGGKFLAMLQRSTEIQF